MFAHLLKKKVKSARLETSSFFFGLLDGGKLTKKDYQKYWINAREEQ